MALFASLITYSHLQSRLIRIPRNGDVAERAGEDRRSSSLILLGILELCNNIIFLESRQATRKQVLLAIPPPPPPPPRRRALIPMVASANEYCPTRSFPEK